MGKQIISLKVNGEAQEVEVPSRRLLADLLRDDLFLTGTKRGCETGVCGACSVLVNGKVIKSCLMLAVQARGCEVTTVEGLAQGGTAGGAAGSTAGGELGVLQQCFAQHGGLQCGYCTPGFLMAATALLAANPHPADADVRAALDGNLCRCTGYAGIVDAILAAAARLRGAPLAGEQPRGD